MCNFSLEISFIILMIFPQFLGVSINMYCSSGQCSFSDIPGTTFQWLLMSLTFSSSLMLQLSVNELALFIGIFCGKSVLMINVFVLMRTDA
uniref:Uncharacterized protein n=1 Tax=Anguilla anguilla TaxID=7936 RepID=A0A0E9WP02_ANGAN